MSSTNGGDETSPNPCRQDPWCYPWVSPFSPLDSPLNQPLPMDLFPRSTWRCMAAKLPCKTPKLGLNRCQGVRVGVWLHGGYKDILINLNRFELDELATLAAIKWLYGGRTVFYRSYTGTSVLPHGFLEEVCGLHIGSVQAPCGMHGGTIPCYSTAIVISLSKTHQKSFSSQ